jgi:hypothetical protein
MALRYTMAVPVKLKATDVNGVVLEQEVVTIDVSKRGALLKGIRGALRTGDRVSLARQNKVEQFQIAWVGAENTERRGQNGIAAVDPASSFWSDVLETQPEVPLAA